MKKDLFTNKSKEGENKIKISGFTLIELLGVIILLGIIGLITYPVVSSSIKNSEEKAYKETIANIEQAAYKYSVENSLGYDSSPKLLSLLELQQKGFLQKDAIKNPSTEEEMTGCVQYRWDESYMQYDFTYLEECSVNEPEPTMDLTNLNGSFNEAGWAKSDFYVKVTGTGNSYKYCVDSVECTPSVTVNKNSGSVLLSTEGSTLYVCAQAMNTTKYSAVVCSGPYKLDKTVPSITGISDIRVAKGETVDLTTGVEAIDVMSGLNGNMTINPSSVDTSTAGTKQVTYTATDIAGNTTSIIRNVIVDSEAPVINFAVQGSPINSNGWAKANFYIKASITDQSGLGIKSTKWCSTTSGTCTPSTSFTGTEVTPLISTESSNNRICVEAVDNNNKTTTLCSDTYKLDKTAPSAGTATINGTAGSAGWYRSNVTLSANNGSDGLSGHASTTISTTSLTSETSGTTVTVTTTDLAGNTATRSYTIKIDKTAPTAGTANIAGTLGSNGWYKSDVTITPVNGSDTLSGHNSTATNISSITSNTTGTTVTITTSDVAGNTATRSYTIKVDKTAPTFNITTDTSSWFKLDIALNSTSDTMSGIDHYEYYIKLKSAADSAYTLKYSGTNTSYSTTDVTDTIYTIKVIAYDKAGNTTTKVVEAEVTSCFIAGTQVYTENGYKNIEDVKVGDKVWTINLETNDMVLKDVTNTFINETIEVMHITIGNEIVNATPRHRFYILDKGWVRAYYLEIGDKVVTEDGTMEITKVEYEKLQKPINVYNFTVEGEHTYLVTKYSILVHNAKSPTASSVSDTYTNVSGSQHSGGSIQ